MTNEQTEKAIEAVRKHFNSMLEKLEKMKVEQEQDLREASHNEKRTAEASLEKTRQLIDEVKKSQLNMERVLKSGLT
jgi:hypothetical protein